ncbi:hypothetical protein [Corynebacterium matruchotii]|uniref:hypothetical protein n=1 Tax=Corynebacterium matruchotii TaxID=43768 RepID=UPI0028EA56DC|nr:hypothetical protein [Corynebacterium matruchotii]
MPDEKNMLKVLRHQVAQDASLHFYIFFKFETLQKFSTMTCQYGGALLWHWDFTDTPLGFLMRKPIVGLVEFDCSDPESYPAGAFFRSLHTALGSRVMVSDDTTFPETVKSLLVYDYSPATFMGTEEERPGPFDITEELINAGALLTYRVEIYDQPVGKASYWMEFLCVNDSRDELY